PSVADRRSGPPLWRAGSVLARRRYTSCMRLTDMTFVEIEIQQPVRRVVSLVPSVTESLFGVGVGDRVVGRTSFCVSPAPEVNAIEVVGGTKNPKLEKIIALKPDLVLANK